MLLKRGAIMLVKITKKLVSLILCLLIFSIPITSHAQIMNDKFKSKFQRKIEKIIIKSLLDNIKENNYDLYRVLSGFWKGIKNESRSLITKNLKELLIEKGFIYPLYFRTKKYHYPELSMMVLNKNFFNDMKKNAPDLYNYSENMLGLYLYTVNNELEFNEKNDSGYYKNEDLPLVMYTIQKTISVKDLLIQFGAEGLTQFKTYYTNNVNNLKDNLINKLVISLLESKQFYLARDFDQENPEELNLFKGKLEKVIYAYLNAIENTPNQFSNSWVKNIPKNYHKWLAKTDLTTKDLDKIHLEIISFFIRMTMEQNKNQKNYRNTGNFYHLSRTLHKINPLFPDNAYTLPQLIKSTRKMLDKAYKNLNELYEKQSEKQNIKYFITFLEELQKELDQSENFSTIKDKMDSNYNAKKENLNENINLAFEELIENKNLYNIEENKPLNLSKLLRILAIKENDNLSDPLLVLLNFLKDLKSKNKFLTILNNSDDEKNISLENLKENLNEIAQNFYDQKKSQANQIIIDISSLLKKNDKDEEISLTQVIANLKAIQTSLNENIERLKKDEKINEAKLDLCRWGSFLTFLQTFSINADKIVDEYKSKNSFYGLMTPHNIKHLFVHFWYNNIFGKILLKSRKESKKTTTTKVVDMLQIIAIFADYVYDENFKKLKSNFIKYAIKRFEDNLNKPLKTVNKVLGLPEDSSFKTTLSTIDFYLKTNYNKDLDLYIKLLKNQFGLTSDSEFIKSSNNYFFKDDSKSKNNENKSKNNNFSAKNRSRSATSASEDNENFLTQKDYRYFLKNMKKSLYTDSPVMKSIFKEIYHSLILLRKRKIGINTFIKRLKKLKPLIEKEIILVPEKMKYVIQKSIQQKANDIKTKRKTRKKLNSVEKHIVDAMDLLKYKIPMTGTELKTLLILIYEKDKKSIKRIISTSFRQSVSDNIKRLENDNPEIAYIIKPFVKLAMNNDIADKKLNMKEIINVAQAVLKSSEKSPGTFYISIGFTWGWFGLKDTSSIFSTDESKSASRFYLDDKIKFDFMGLLENNKNPIPFRFGVFVGGFLDFTFTKIFKIDTENQPGGDHFLKTGGFIGFHSFDNDFLRFDINFGLAFDFNRNKAWFLGISWNILDIFDLL